MFHLRDYQLEAIAATESEWERFKRTMVVLPTGMGKTVAFGTHIHQLVQEKHRCLMMVHREELMTQAAKKLQAIDPKLRIGWVKAEDNNWQGQDVVLGCTATIGRENRYNQIPPDHFTRVIVDECHHAAGNTYLKAMEHFGAFDPDRGTRVVGYTATPDRNDAGKFQIKLPLSGQPADVWESLAYIRDIPYGMQHGYLVSDIKVVQVQIEGLNLATLARKTADVSAETLGEALESSGAISRSVEAYQEHCRKPDGTMRKGIAFWPTIATARAFTEAMNASGIPTELVIGETSSDERERIYKRAAGGTTTVLSSVGVLTEGFDQPDLEVALIGRLTQSQLLYLQMIGRVFRPWPGKESAMVMDLTGCTDNLDIMCMPNLFGGDMHLKEESDKLVAEPSGEGPDCVPTHTRVMVGEITIQVRDLVARSHNQWMTTPGGKLFIPTRFGYMFLKEDPDDAGSWMVGKTATGYKMRDQPGLRYPLARPETPVCSSHWGWTRRGLPLEYAMAEAESQAEFLDPTVARKKASWRRPSIKASQAQITYAAKLGLVVDEGTTRADAADMITLHQASRLLDK